MVNNTAIMADGLYTFLFQTTAHLRTLSDWGCLEKKELGGLKV